MELWAALTPKSKRTFNKFILTKYSNKLSILRNSSKYYFTIVKTFTCLTIHTKGIWYSLSRYNTT